MNIEIKIKKGIPVEQIEKFEDRVVYNTVVATREYTKSRNAYPVLTGTLRSSEVAAPIVKVGNKSYGLTNGVDYATTVWGYKDVHWTNPSTRPQWYYTMFREKGASLLLNSVMKSIKEIK